MAASTLPLSTVWTSKNLTPDSLGSIKEWLMSSSGDSRANHSHLQDDKTGLRTNETPGPQPLVPFVRYDPSTSFWRMYPALCRQAISEQCSETWPNAGTMRLGVCYLLPKQERHINGNACGSVHFGMTQTDFRETYENAYMNLITKPQSSFDRQRWPTPTAFVAGDTLNLIQSLKTKSGEKAKLGERAYRDGKQGHVQMTLNRAVVLQEVNQGRIPHPKDKLNPDWVERLMGLPHGWTSKDPLLESRFQRWLKGWTSEWSMVAGSGFQAWVKDNWEASILPIGRKQKDWDTRHRMLGNGWVPATAAAAWIFLSDPDLR